MRTTARPALVRHSLIAALALVAAAVSLRAHAHGDAPHATAAPSEATELSGRLETVTVIDRANNSTTRYLMLAVPDAPRYRLDNASTSAGNVPVTVRGRVTGRTIAVESIRPAAQSAPTPRATAARDTLVGTVRYFHMDYPDGTSEFGYDLAGDSGRRNVIDIGTPLPGVANGARASIAGSIDASGHIDVDTIELLGSNASPTKHAAATNVAAAVTTKNYAVAPLKFPSNTTAPFTYGADPSTFATMTSNLFGVAPTKSVAEYYKEVSFGNQLLAGFIVNAGASTWLQATVAKPTTCGTSAQLNAVLSTIETQSKTLAASANPPTANLDWNAYPDGILYVSNSLPCGWSGLGYIGFARAYTNSGSTSLLVVGHEMGHNFGLLHAGSVNCGTGVVIKASGCSVAEYGDPYVIMGNQRAGHFNAYQKNDLGYIAGKVATHSSGTATYTIGPIESPGQTRYAIQVPTSIAARTYWVEFRQSIGFDAGFPGIAALGAQIRLGGSFEQSSGSDDTQFLDLNPNPAGSFTDSVLLQGQTYTDSTTGVNIQVVNASASSIDVQVSFGGGGGATSTSTVLASSLNPSTQGQSVTFTATVTGNAPTGSASFKDGGVAIAGCASVALSAGAAQCATSALAVGVHSITADYSGDAGNTASSSSPLSQTVKAGSTTAVVSSLNPSTAGTSVTFTATVTGNAPTGNVAFTSDGSSIAGCTAQALSGSGNSRTATCATSALTAATHSIVAAYAGDGVNATSNSSPLSQVVNNAGPSVTTTTLGSSLNPSTAGALVLFTATVNGNAPTGNVAFTSDGVSIAGCSAIALSGSGNSRTAACSTAALAAGAHAIVASYAGNAGNLTSANAPFTQTVNAAAGSPTSTTVTSTLNPASSTGAVTLVANVGGPGAITGTVSFTANGAGIAGCAAVSMSGASATCNTHLASGAYSIVATYGGDASHQPSSSKVYSQVVSLPGIGNTLAFLTSSSAVNESAGNAFVTVLRIGDATSPASVSYTTVGNTAAANADFTPVSGTLVWNANDTAPRTIAIPIANDAIAEGNESFNVALSNAVGATIGAASLTVTIQDDESPISPFPSVGTVVRNDYGPMTLTGGTLNLNSISNLTSNAVIQLGATAGTPGSMVEIDFQGLDLGAGNTISVRSGAAGQTVLLKNVNAAGSTIGGTWQAVGGNGAGAPTLVVQDAGGIVVSAGGSIVAPAGLYVSTPGGTLTNHGNLDGGPSLRIDAATVHGTGRFSGDAIAAAFTGFLNMPQFAGHFESNAIHLYPGTGGALRLDLAGYGSSSQVVNVVLHGNATLSMPSLWPNGSTMPANNRPTMPGEIRPAGVGDPAYGGGSMIVRSTGTLTLDGGASGDFVFPGGIAFIADGALDVHGTAIDNGWTTSGTPYQGVFMQAPSIVDSVNASGISIRTNNLNWVNVSVRPNVPMHTWTLQTQGDGTTSFSAADASVPHFNFYSLVSEAAAAGLAYGALVNPQVIDFITP